MMVLAMMVSALNAQQPEKLPVDPAVRVGHLENGLTYYIRHNELPKQRCEFHIAQAVGATLEEDDQNGLAHFLEHMCFNGTEHFEGKGIINYFESIGVNFGGNINAYTSLDQTVYRLSEVPTYREGIIDSALLVMHDWSCAVSLLGEEIDAERGVIREEWRTGNTAQRRAWKNGQIMMFPGTRYATRDVIGDTAVINNFSYDAIRAYYKKWYGPDLQAIIVVGDIDVDQIEAKIKALWANVPARQNRGERPYVEIPDNNEPIVGIYKDKEAPNTGITMLYKHAPLPKELKGTNVDFAQSICHQLIYTILSERLTEERLRADASIVGGVMAYTDYFPTLDAFYSRIGTKEGREKDAFQRLTYMIEKMRRYGFTEAELERAKTETLSSTEKQYNERNATENIQYVQEYIGNFLDGTAIPGIEVEYEMIQQLLPYITTDMLNEMAKSYVTENNIAVYFSAPDKEGVNVPTEAEILAEIAAMPSLEIEAPVAETVDNRLVKKLPKKGKIKKVGTDPTLGTTTWVLKNGVCVVLKPTTFKQDEILLQAFSYGGESLVKTEDMVSCDMATTAIGFMGYGDFSLTALQKALKGKNVNLDMSINGLTESVSGYSSVKDLETMFQLLYLGFTAPRRDEEAYRTLMGLLENQLLNKDANPKAIFRDSVSLMTGDHSPRIVLNNMETLKQVALDKIMRIYRERFANPADFTFILVGNIDPNDKELQRLVNTYLGGLKTTKKREAFVDQHIRAPKGVVKNYFAREMSTHTASNRIQYTSYDIPYTLENGLTMELIGRILSTRYLESIREREGGSYGVGTYGYVTAWPVNRAALIMQFDTDPDKQKRLMEIIHEEVQTIIENGPLTSDLDKEKASMLKDFSENVEKNDWWLSTLDEYLKLGVNNYTDYVKTVESIDGAKVQHLLKQLVEAGNMFEVVMMPE